MDRSAWNGKFVMTSQKNVEEFLGKLGVPADQAKIVKAMNLTYDISSVGDDYTVKQIGGGKENIISVILGKESEITTIDGMKLKGTIIIDEKNEVYGKYEGGIVEHMVITGSGVITDTTTKDGVSLVRTFKRA